MRIIKLNVGSNLIDVSQNLDSGSIREYIDSGNASKKQNDLIITLAGILSESNYDFVGIECKYLFGKRDKRLEVIFKYDNIIYIVKISKQKKFDKDAIELDNIISDISQKHNISIKGFVLLIDEFNNDIIESYSNSMQNSITFLSYNQFIERYGIFNK
jgi:hypothetical protein